VGGGVLELLERNRETLTQKVGSPLEVAHILVRDPNKARAPSCDSSKLTSDPARIWNDPNLDVVIEVMGGEEPARTYIQTALERGAAEPS
jgi:homoserine dehydrogenase